ncbi:hypothetical protein [Ignatzschineria larvae]|nr:hypothetical protein [Ignatzschineria larvae]
MTKRSYRIAGENDLILIIITCRQIAHFSTLNDIAIPQSYAGNYDSS